MKTGGVISARDINRSAANGFTLLEVLVATLIMGIAISGILSGLSGAARNASRLTDHDRVTLLAQQKMDDLNANTVDQAARMIAGTARSMGVEVVG